MWGEKIQSLARLLFSQQDLESLELTQKQFSQRNTRAQKEIEGWYFGIRKHLFDYDSVVDKQRRRVYKLRDDILESEDDQEKRDQYLTLFKDEFLTEAKQILITQITNAEITWQSVSDLLIVLNKEYGLNMSQPESYEYAQLDYEGLKAVLIERLDRYFTQVFEKFDPQLLFEIFRGVHLHFIDKMWVDHIDEMQNLREKVGLMSYAQLDPLVMYKKESFEKFQALMAGILNTTVAYLMKFDFEALALQQAWTETLSISTDGQANDQKVIDILADAAHNIPQPSVSSTHQAAAHVRDSRASVFEESDEFEVFEVGEEPVQVVNTSAHKTRPNDPCPCWSGKKYKKCHGK